MKRNNQTNNHTMYRAGKMWTVFCLSMLALFALGTAHAAKQTLTDVTYKELPGERLKVTLSFSGSAPDPKVFTVNDPARLSVDMPDTKLDLDKKLYYVNAGEVKSLSLADSEHMARLVVRMQNLQPFDTKVAGNTITLKFGSGNVGRRLSGGALHPAGGHAGGKPKISATVKDVEFRRTETGAGRIVVSLSERQGPVDVSQKGNTIVARLPHTKAPESLVNRLDVVDFATPVKYVDVRNKPNGARIRVTPFVDQYFDQISYQTENKFVMEFQPISKAEHKRRTQNKETYKGERISLSFQEVGIRSVLQIIAEVANVNMVVSESVNGSIALQLEDVPWDQALDIILTSQGLGMRREGNVITIAPLKEIARRQKNQLEAKKATRGTAPLVSTLIQINYADAGQIASLVKSKGASYLSDRGSIAVSKRTNALLVRDTRANIQAIRQIIDKLDKPNQQVLIETRIVSASRDFSRNLGITIDGGISTEGAATQYGFTVGLPVSDSNGSLSVTLGSDFDLGLTLQAMESESKGTVISAPRVITTSGEKAFIQQGKEVPYLEAASSGAAAIQFKEAVLKLEVTPRITPNNRVVMDLTVVKDTVVESTLTPTAPPSIKTQELQTRLLLESGETVVLGGIYTQKNNSVVSKVPVLSEIPFIGALFRSTKKGHSKDELLIFVTPTILKQDMSVQ